MHKNRKTYFYNIRKEVLRKMDFFMIIKAFVVGGLICILGQLLIDLTAMTPARILVLFVTVGVALTALGLYEYIVDFAGGGATVPLFGFGYTLARGVEKAVLEDGWLGVFSGGLAATAPGVAFAIVLGVISSVVTKSKDKS